MKKVILLLAIIFAAHVAFAQYKPLDEGSRLKFVIGNLGFDVNGSFTGFKGMLNFDPKAPASSNFDITLDAASINTDNSLRDNHLKDDGFFDVKKYPLIHFVSEKIETGKKDAFVVTGKLTIKGITKEIAFPFTAMPTEDGFVFKGSFKIRRMDFGVGGISTVSNELTVMLNVVAKKV